MIFRQWRHGSLRRVLKQQFSVEYKLLDLDDHIQRYKTRKFADNYMDMLDMPEMGNKLHNMSGANGIQWCYEAEEEALKELMGPDQVSPHYENFTFSRKMGLFALGLGFTQLIFTGQGNIQHALHAAIHPFVIFGFVWFFHLEMKKSTFAPLLMKFYQQVGAHEVMSLVRNEAENYYYKWRSLESIAREQLEYLDLHKEFQYIKSEAVERLLVAERAQLRQALQQRAATILRSAEQMESTNLRQITGRVLEVIKQEAGKVKNEPDAEIIEDSFKMALDGIRSGKMDYRGDKVLSRIIDVAKREIEGVNSLSEKQKREMVELTEAQFLSIKNADRMAQQQFLKKGPAGLDSVLRENETYAQIMAKW